MSVYNQENVPGPKNPYGYQGEVEGYGKPVPNDSVATPRLIPMPAPAAPGIGAADPNQSPAYLAFLRGAGLSEAQARASVARQRAGLQGQLEAQRPIWAQNMEQSLSRVLNNAASRGTVRSGNRLQGQALAQQDVQRQQASFEGNIANQQSGLQDQLQERLLDLARQREEQKLGAQQDVYSSQVKDYQNNLTNFYLQQILNGGGVQ